MKKRNTFVPKVRLCLNVRNKKIMVTKMNEFSTINITPLQTLRKTSLFSLLPLIFGKGNTDFHKIISFCKISNVKSKRKKME